jgi:hypothetical protein
MLIQINPEKHFIPFSLVGISAIDHFVQRDNDMKKLEEFFFPIEPCQARRKMFVVYGLGGIGKTQLCVEFIRKYQSRYTAVLWMDGSSENALQQSFVDLLIRIPSDEVSSNLVEAATNARPDMEAVVKGVLGWLSAPSNPQWLLVIDDANHNLSTQGPDALDYDVTRYCPTADHGSILISSRLSTLTGPQNSLRLTVVIRDQSLAIFEANSGKYVSGTH